MATDFISDTRPEQIVLDTIERGDYWYEEGGGQHRPHLDFYLNLGQPFGPFSYKAYLRGFWISPAKFDLYVKDAKEMLRDCSATFVDVEWSYAVKQETWRYRKMLAQKHEWVNKEKHEWVSGLRVRTITIPEWWKIDMTDALFECICTVIRMGDVAMLINFPDIDFSQRMKSSEDESSEDESSEDESMDDESMDDESMDYQSAEDQSAEDSGAEDSGAEDPGTGDPGTRDQSTGDQGSVDQGAVNPVRWI